MDSPERPSLLFLLGTDPRSSARPAEAIRVAAGVAAWKKVDVTVYLRGPAVLALGEWLDELRDEDNYSRYLPLLVEGQRPIYVEAGARELNDLGTPSFPFVPITDVQLAELAAHATSVLRF